MPFLVAAVVLVGALGLLNLLLTLGVLRRLRARAGTSPGGMPSAGTSPALGPGAPVGEFTAVTSAGDPVSDETLSGLVGFFSADCDACHALLPGFVERARALGAENVLAVIGGHDPETVATLTPVARVILAEPDGGPVARAFRNVWTPSLYMVGEDRRIVASGARFEELPELDRDGR
ncbi:peroxiredoxin family protein [Actinomadura roseirufa]|uniref:peroxiredoxin family protein n=1 Tax=Actinomadura roseirufa TaxID=2094049 RepID=UPI0010418F3E|nr:TlpA family protein disulfide reductase [Actinomadura roseirufa]